MLNKILQVIIRTKMLQGIARLIMALQLMPRQAVEFFSFLFKEELAVCLFQNRKQQFKLNLNKQLKQLMWSQELEQRDLDQLESQ
jgi:hypothetical protein